MCVELCVTDPSSGCRTRSCPRPVFTVCRMWLTDWTGRLVVTRTPAVRAELRVLGKGDAAPRVLGEVGTAVLVVAEVVAAVLELERADTALRGDSGGPGAGRAGPSRVRARVGAVRAVAGVRVAIVVKLERVGSSGTAGTGRRRAGGAGTAGTGAGRRCGTAATREEG